MKALHRDGYDIHQGQISPDEVALLRLECDALVSSAETPCVRNIRQRSKSIAALSIDPRLLRLIPDDLSPVRSILFDKTPRHNWPVAWHQDLTIALGNREDIPGYGPWSEKDGIDHVQPPINLLENMVALRIHLDDTPATNGALRVLPGSHEPGRLSPEELSRFSSSSPTTCECSPGDILVMHPLLLHSSKRSTDPSRRRVIHIEYATRHLLDPRLKWHEEADTLLS